METSINLFDYNLPENRIAQHSVEPRDHSKLMVLDRSDQSMTHRSFFEIGVYLREGDVLVMNKSKVFKARLRVDGFEVFLLRPEGVTPPVMEGQGEACAWIALMKPRRKAKVGDTWRLPSSHGGAGGGCITIVLKEKRADGTVLLTFDRDVDDVLALCDRVGEIPIPPYVNEMPERLDQYQNVYAQETGSVAAPTAGFHFTDRLLDELRQKGVQIEFVTLHVGLGTFQPVKVDTLEEHDMHSEFAQIDADTAGRINDAKREGRRVIAVGTTTVRALEGVARSKNTPPGGVFLRGFAGDVNLFITPGFDFKIIDGLVTNFHLPKSTLLVLVSALAGREFIMRAYEEAISNNYRFYSFGDAMLIL